MASMVPALEQLKKEGGTGRKKINQYPVTRRLRWRCSRPGGLPSALRPGNPAHDPGMFFRLTVVITLVGGTMFLMWLGEQITSRGIGNGISLIIFVGYRRPDPAGHIAQFLAQGLQRLDPADAGRGGDGGRRSSPSWSSWNARARSISSIPPSGGDEDHDGQSSHLPIKVNPAGVILAIFASSLLLLPVTISTFSGKPDWPDHVDDLGLFRSRAAALPAVLHGDYDRVLRLFLHVQRQLQTRRRRRQPEESGRFNPVSALAKTEDYLTMS